MAKISDIEITKLLFDEGAAPSTPASTNVALYAKADGLLYSKDDAGVETLVSGGAGGGSVATDAIWDAAGDLAVGSGANTAARLAIGATNGMSLQRVSGAVAWALPSGHPFNKVAVTSDVTITGTSEGSETNVVTSGSVAYDGSTEVCIEFHCPRLSVTPSAAGRGTVILLYEDSTLVGRIGVALPIFVSGQSHDQPVLLRHFRTPSAASHTYSIKAYKTNASDTVVFYMGSGGAAAQLAGSIVVTKA